MPSVHDNTRQRTAGEFSVSMLRILADVVQQHAGDVQRAADKLREESRRMVAQADTLATELQRGEDPLTTRERLLAATASACATDETRQRAP